MPEKLRIKKSRVRFYYLQVTLVERLLQITNCQIGSLSLEEIALPIKLGGLGIRQSKTLATPCLIATSFATTDLVSTILLSYVTALSDSLVTEARDLWKSLSFAEFPCETIGSFQLSWEVPIFNHVSSHILESSFTLINSARILASRSKQSEAWLQALPSRNLGTLLDDNAFRIAIGLRLGLKLCLPHKCVCGADIYELALHGLSCKKSASRLSRHTHANDIIKRALISADIPYIREPLGCCRADGKKPDGLTLIPYKQGRSLVWDFTCCDTESTYTFCILNIHPTDFTKGTNF